VPRVIKTPIPEVEQYRDVSQHDEKKNLGGFGDKYQKLVSEPLHEIMHREDRYEKSPFLNLADELLLALKENLTSQLTIVSASNGIINKSSRKNVKFKKTFGKFPTTKLVLEPTNRLGKKRPRWE
jgi:hypothetical protein